MLLLLEQTLAVGDVGTTTVRSTIPLLKHSFRHQGEDPKTMEASLYQSLALVSSSEVERLSALSTEVVQVWAGRNNCKYEVRKKVGQQAKDKSIESWDDWARERKWSWGRRREEEERWTRGRGEVDKQSVPKQ